MERLHYPIPINPNAKYLSNSISNVLYSIQKFDQSTLAWPTCQPRRVIARKKKGSPSEVPLAGTESSVIQNKGGFVSSGNARAEKKNTFYQILLASQDQPPFKEPRRFKRKKYDSQFKRDSKDDSIYSDIYDIVRTHTQYKRQRRYKSPPPERHISFTETPPVMEVYKIRPLATENRDTKSIPKLSKVKYPKGDNYKLQDRTNELSKSKGQPSKPKTSASKTSKKEFLKFPLRDNRMKENLKEVMHRSKSLATKHPTKVISRGRERIAQTSINKEKFKDKSKTKCNFPTTQNPVNDVQEVREIYEKTDEKKANSRGETDKSLFSQHPKKKLNRVRRNSRKTIDLQANSEEETGTSTSKENPEEGNSTGETNRSLRIRKPNKLRKRTRNIIDLQGNTDVETGTTTSSENPKEVKKRPSRLRSFKNENNSSMIYIVRPRNSKGRTSGSITGKRPKKEIYRIQERSNKDNKNEKEEFVIQETYKRDNFFLGRSRENLNQQNIFKDKSNKAIVESKSKFENTNKPQASLIGKTERIDIKSKVNIQDSAKKIKKVRRRSHKTSAQEGQSKASSDESIFRSLTSINPLKGIYKVHKTSKLLSNHKIDANKKRVKKANNSSTMVAISKNNLNSIHKVRNKAKIPTDKKEISIERIISREKLEPFQRLKSITTPLNSLASNGSFEYECDSCSTASEYFHDEPSRDVEDVIFVKPPNVLSGYRKSLESRKSSTDLGMSEEMYQEKLRRVKQFLNREEIFDGNHTGSSSMSIDIEGIQDRDLLLYPYSEIYEKKIKVTVEKESNVNKRIITEPKLKLKPPDEQIENEILKERKTACIMCRTIKRNPAEEEAPFLEEMRKEQRRRELLAYRANIETQGDLCRKSVPFEKPEQYNRAGPISLNDLSRRELYSLESRTILFSQQRNFISFPKKSNQIIFLGES
ncbi:hypothetical protein KR084_008431, partial [Drosophila pseudotakahashii]